VCINVVVRIQGLSYSQFIANLKKAKVEINRKMLAEIAVNDPEEFAKLLTSVSSKDANDKVA